MTERTIDAQLPFSVIVPINRPTQFNLNVARSPGLAEVGVDVVPVAGAGSAAEALEIGKAHAKHDWIVFCHQDVYFPRGSGYLISGLLSSIADSERSGRLIGFAGLIADLQGQARYAGLVIDRVARFDHCIAGGGVVSLDEFAIVLSRHSRHRIDGTLGWHGWATDLCLTAAREGWGAGVTVERVPLYHNSFNDSKLPEAFHASIRKLQDKFPEIHQIRTLNGNFVRPSPGYYGTPTYRINFK